MKCNRCDFDIKSASECYNCGEVNEKIYEHYRVDALNFLNEWIEQAEYPWLEWARDYAKVYEMQFPGCPVRIRKVTEEEIT